MKNIRAAVKEMASAAIECAQELNEGEVEEMIGLLLKAKNIFVAGSGHSGLIGKAFAMRLMHLGFKAFVVGDVTTPGLKSGDVVVAISNSGETTAIIAISKKAKELSGKVIGITTKPNSTLGEIADQTVKISPATKSEKYPILSILGEQKHGQMSGTFFGVNTLLFLHGLICELALCIKQTPEQIDQRHANI